MLVVLVQTAVLVAAVDQEVAFLIRADLETLQRLLHHRAIMAVLHLLLILTLAEVVVQIKMDLLVQAGKAVTAEMELHHRFLARP